MTYPEDQEAFHAGERALQARVGLEERLREVGSVVVRDHMPDQHRALFAELPLLWLGALDDAGQPWASVISGNPGFVASPDPYTLAIHGPLHAHDPLRTLLLAGRAVGVLGLQLETRRRNRMNGVVRSVAGDRYEIGVMQSFGNCPKYIHVRQPAQDGRSSFVRWDRVYPETSRLSADACQIIAQADTFFIASASAAALPTLQRNQGVDVSHRGGPAGFVTLIHAEHATTLLAPDYVGNFFFNTFGNLQTYPQAGLLFPDFASGALLALTVDAEVIWEGALVAAFPHAQRLVRFHVRSGYRVEDALPFRFGA